jgi:outer membrane receptor protein involved in Fe transport
MLNLDALALPGDWELFATVTNLFDRTYASWRARVNSSGPGSFDAGNVQPEQFRTPECHRGLDRPALKAPEK